jgi:hypothetical protein
LLSWDCETDISSFRLLPFNLQVSNQYFVLFLFSLIVCFWFWIWLIVLTVESNVSFVLFRLDFMF